MVILYFAVYGKGISGIIAARVFAARAGGTGVGGDA